MVVRICKFCGQERELIKSHIIPERSWSVVDRIQKGIVGVSGVHIQRPMRCVFPRGHLHRQRTNQRSHGLVLISMALRF